MALYHSPQITTSGILLCLDAGNSKSYPGSGTSWSDLTGTNSVSTLTNGPTYSSGAIVFDGANDYVNIPTGAGSNTFPYVVSVWFKTTATSGTIVCLGTTVAPNDYLLLRMSSGLVNFAYDNSPPSGDGTDISSTLTYNDNTWHNAVGYRDGVRTGQLYVDGQLVAIDTDSAGSTSLVGYTAIEIGRNASLQTDYFAGSVSIVTTYNTAITGTDILSNYNAIRQRYGV